jgi:hypothetical protein
MLNSKDKNDRLELHGVYTCPVCRHGKIQAIPLMEAFACDLCHHIFTANFERQLLKMVDSQIPLTWYWNGKVWKGIQRENFEFGWGYFIAGTAFVGIPTSIIALATYLFPTIPGSNLYWLPITWTVLTFLCHLFCLIWLIVEYYQFPVFLYLRSVSRRVWARN